MRPQCQRGWSRRGPPSQSSCGRGPEEFKCEHSDCCPAGELLDNRPCCQPDLLRIPARSPDKWPAGGEEWERQIANGGDALEEQPGDGTDRNEYPIDDEGQDLLDEAVVPLAEVPLSSAAAPDGLPDPLAMVAEMLPGGRATRGKPAIVYVQTKLDTELVSALRDRDPTLVVLSGNAGDGKTAFLAELIEAAGEVYEPGVRNEYDDIEIGPGHRYKIVLDGSEDSEDCTNDDLLQGALDLFRGPGPVESARRGTLLAINKGRLLKFLQSRTDAFGYLWDLVRAVFLGEGSPRDTPYILIDLNDRTFVGPDFESSLMLKVLRRLTEWPGWDGCLQCPARDLCPAYANVTLLQVGHDRAADSPAYRLWRIFAAADLDDRVHITARHVVSQLARLVGAARRCPDIRKDVMKEATFGPANYLHNAVFDPLGSRVLGDSSTLDEVLATYDPTERDSPSTGRRLHAVVALPALDLVIPAERRERYLDDEASDLAESRIDVEPERGAPDYRQRTLALTHSLGRKLYLQGDREFGPGLALETMDEFLSIAGSGTPNEALPRVISNLNAALGVEAEGLPDLLSPRDYARGLRGRGFAMLVPSSNLTIVPGTGLGVPYAQNEYLQSWPRSILLRAVDPLPGEARVVATLAIPLLLFEILDRAGRGFRPASQTERGYMVRLRGFYRLLSEHPWSKRPSYILYDSGHVIGKAKIDDKDFSLMSF